MSVFGRPAQLRQPVFSEWPMCNATNSCVDQECLQCANRPIDLNVAEVRFTLIGFLIPYYSQTLRNHLLEGFGIVSKSSTHNYLKKKNTGIFVPFLVTYHVICSSCLFNQNNVM